jgi:putative endonuclease
MSVKRARQASPVRRAAEHQGRAAETRAAIMLFCKLYRVIGRRVKTPAGEIDLVALSPSGILCFVEVKARDAEDAAADALSRRQRGRITRAAQVYMAQRPGLRHKAVRFDAILVTPGRWPRHVKDAWRPDSHGESW